MIFRDIYQSLISTNEYEVYTDYFANTPYYALCLFPLAKRDGRSYVLGVYETESDVKQAKTILEQQILSCSSDQNRQHKPLGGAGKKQKECHGVAVLQIAHHRPKQESALASGKSKE